MPAQAAQWTEIDVPPDSTSGCVLSDPDSIENLMHNDAEDLREHFKAAFDQVQSTHKRPRVLIAGSAGAGKSSIINTVFGAEIAQEGAGRPITQHFHRYEPEGMPIILYDSKGLEVGMALEEFISSTRDYFSHPEETKEEEENSLENSIEQRVDVVWYIVNSAAARFQDFEEHICRQLFVDIPIIFILNKADISTTEQRAALRQVIDKLQLSNCLGVYDCVTQKYTTRALNNCEECGSDDLIVYRKQKVGICEDCGHSTSTQISSGIENILKVALETLPLRTKDAFVAAQRASFRLKEDHAKRCIEEFHTRQTHASTSHSLLSMLVTMLTRLSYLWNFRNYAHLSAALIAKDVVGTFTLRDKIFLFIHKNKHQRLRTTAIGILWNHCLRELAKMMLIESVEGTSDSLSEERDPLILAETFHSLSLQNLDFMEESLRCCSLSEVLEKEMPAMESECKENLPVQGMDSIQSIATLCEGKPCWSGWLTPEVCSPLGPSPAVKHVPTKSKRKHSKRKARHHTKTKKHSAE